jgi:hypothetical protein
VRGQRRQLERDAARYLLAHYRAHGALPRRWSGLLGDRTLARIVIRGEVERCLRIPQIVLGLRRIARKLND